MIRKFELHKRSSGTFVDMGIDTFYHNHLRALLSISLIAIVLISSEVCFAQGLGVGTENPTEMLDVNGKIRMREGGQQGYVLQSDSLGVMTWVKASDISQKAMLWVTDFGVAPSDSIADSRLIQAALDSAANRGVNLYFPPGLYNIDTTLDVPAGVIMVGSGIGRNPLIAPFEGTVLQYLGNGWAVNFSAHSAGMQDMSVRDAFGNGEGGVSLIASDSLVESIRFQRVIIYGFTSGTGLYMFADNDKGVAYSSFYDLRIRHCKIGIHIETAEEGFVNSNSFHKGIISGGGYDKALFIEGGNDNDFWGQVIEPYVTNVAHIYVERGQFIARGLRLEGAQQPSDRPLLYFAPGTNETIIDGTYAGGFILDKGDNELNLSSSNSLNTRNPGTNIIKNSALLGIVNQDIPTWEFSHNNFLMEVLPPEVVDAHRVLKLSIPPGEILYLGPTEFDAPRRKVLPRESFANFGAYIKTADANFAYTTFLAKTGVITSLPHPAHDDWHFIGLRGETPDNHIRPKFMLDNQTGTDTAVAYITCPTFNWGMTLPAAEAAPFPVTGGQVYGTLSTSLVEVYVPDNNILVLPKEANTFIIKGNNGITRINHTGDDKFPRGTIITLLFENAYIGLPSNAYLKLKAPYSSKEKSSLTLVSMGDGTWWEVNRNL
ncbi:MAG: glycosyl hydrolase family 28-related protein [Bacteroidota bacterium]